MMAITGLSSAYGNVYESRCANTYVTNRNSSFGSRFQDKKIEKRAKKKSSLKNHFEKRKYLRKKFEKRQAAKEMYAKLQEKTALSRKQNASRVIVRYEASILKS